MGEPLPDDPLAKAVAKLRDEVRTLHEAHTAKAKAAWYAKSPVKEILAHSTTVCVELLLGLLAHSCTGGHVSIEVADQSKPAPMPAATTTATIVIPADQEPELAYTPTPTASASTAPAKRPGKAPPAVATAQATALPVSSSPAAPPTAPAAVQP
jgi:hypothetical protein